MLVVALVLLLVPVLAVGGYLAWLNQIVTNNVKNELLLPDSAAPGALPTDAGGNPVPLPAGKGTNYLIIGGDAGPRALGVALRRHGAGPRAGRPPQRHAHPLPA